jgi:ADP-heptose:LPS heptosyltransferase
LPERGVDVTLINMKKPVKDILRWFSLNALIREMRETGYRLLDGAGEIYFSILRLAGAISGHRSFNRDKVSKILIIRIDRIGDLILSTPAIKAVRGAYPEAEIHLLVAEYTKPLVINNPYVDRVLIDGKDVVLNDYDLDVALHPGTRQNRMAFKCGAKWRAGYTGRGGGFYLTHKVKDDRAKRKRHEVESVLEVVNAVGCKAADTGLDISVTEEGELFAGLFYRKHDLDGKRVAVIHPGARQEHIRWRKEGFSGVADKLVSQGVNVVLIGGKNEIPLIQEMESLMNMKPVIAVNMSLTRLVSLIRKSDIFIGNSTGTMHIAAALRVPVVAIFGNIHPLDCYEEWGPWGEGHIVVSKKLDCPECHPSDCGTFDCMRLISVQDVFEAAQVQLSKKINKDILALSTA